MIDVFEDTPATSSMGAGSSAFSAVGRPVVLSVSGLTHAYQTGAGPLPILNNCRFEMKSGEIVGLVGPSGAGKSTFLHLVGLLDKVQTGQILIAGEQAAGVSKAEQTRLRREHLGYVYQFHHLLPEYNAIENVAAPLLISGAKRKTALVQAERLLTLLGLKNRILHKPAQLSGGEQQRVAIARAIASKPKLLIADEPTGNLDPVTSGHVFQSLFDLSRLENIAVLVATHNMSLTSYMDRIVTLREGQIVSSQR